MQDRSLAERLAGQLATDDGLLLARRLQAAGLVGAPPAAEPVPWPKPPEPISIWSPAEMDGEAVWIRPDPLPLGDHFATRKVLRKKSSPLPLRVAFFGESVAAGYLYAPHVTPASVLTAQLTAAAGAGQIEVVDLARTNETLAGLATTVRQSLQIQPDILVLFAGNNWNLLETPELSAYAPAVTARRRFAQALAEGGIAEAARQAEEALRAKAADALGTVATLARAVGIPVVVVIPEVNLADWENRQPVAWLPGDGTPRWYRLYGEALRALAEGRAECAAGLAREMTGLDGGTCPTPWRILGRAALAAGDLDEAVTAFRAEVEAARYASSCFLPAPQASDSVRGLLRDLSRRHGFFAVDLPALFAEHTGSSLSGRRLFLDYCHLTFEGIRVAMAAVAARVLALSGLVEEEPTAGEIAALEIPSPSPAVEATALLGAALHGAHRLLTTGDKRAVLEPYCEAALAADPRVESAMLDLIAARAAPAPAVLTAAQQRNFASPYRLGLQHGWAYDHLDAEALSALLAALARRGRPVPEEIERQLLEHQGLRPEGTELARLPFFHLWEPLERPFPEVMEFEDLPRRAYLRSPWPETGFALIADARQDVELTLTLRLAAVGERRPERSAPVVVALNGAAVGAVETPERWQKASVRLPRYRLWPGLNRLTLRWPELPPAGDAALAEILRRLELGRAADLHPIFGEVFSVVARPVR